MIKSFLSYIEYEKRYSRHTLISYKNDLAQFEEHLKYVYHLEKTEDADFNMIRSWIVELSDNGLIPRSINRKIATVKSFFKFLQRNELIKKNPASRIKPLKAAQKNPSFVEEEKLLSLLDNFEFGDDFSSMRDKLIMEILYGTGIRLSELIAMKWADIDFYHQTVKVRGKRDKERILPVPVALLDLIKKFELLKNMYFSEDNQPQDYLIVSDKGKQSYPMLIYNTVKKYLNIITCKLEMI